MFQEEDEQLTEFELFFGSVPVTLHRVQGLARSCGNWNPDTTKNSDIPHQFKATDFGDEYSRLVIPLIPAWDDLDFLGGDPAALPPPLRIPLVKGTPLSPPHPLSSPPEDTSNSTILGSLRAVASGVRSAIVSLGPYAFRLKGCGNNNEGFPTAPIPATGQETIRGCCFQHTCSRELALSIRVAEMLEGHTEMRCANRPIGYYEYDIPDAPYPLVKRRCGLFETLGEKRLAHHVLAGLDRLLPIVISTDKALEVSLLFPEAREGPVLETWMANLMEVPLLDIYYEPLNETIPEFRQLFTDDGPQHRFSHLWDEQAKAIASFTASRDPSSDQLPSLFAYLYWRFGWEIGTVMRLFKDRGFCWGTYVDGLGAHCNAHTNNLCLVREQTEPSGSSPPPFLAVLDFDMAFDEESHAFTLPDGSKDPQQFTKWHSLETQMMGLAISGGDCSTGVSPVETVAHPFSQLRWALRDTMHEAFRLALDGQTDRHPPIPHLHGVCYNLLRLALIMTCEDVA